MKKFKWTEETEKAFNDIKQLLINPPVPKAPTPDDLFHLESNTSQEGVGSTLLQKQGNECVDIGYHSKRLPQSAKNFGVTELELTGLLVNIHGFMQLLYNRYFEVLVDHKAIEYMIKSKTKSPTTRLKTLLLKLSDCQRNIQIFIYKLLTPFDPQILNIHKYPNHWYQLIPHYRSLENTFPDNLTSIKL